MLLLSVAYPKLNKSAESLIFEFRKKYDHQYVDVIDAHWTMIFPGSSEGVAAQDIKDHISSVAVQSAPINFCCRYALVCDDDAGDNYYIFLVPDEGFSEISRLHDRLYSSFMRPKLRLDLPYIPHIGIATSKDPDYLYELAQEWNASGHEICGVIDTLTLCSYDGVKIKNLQNFPLQSAKLEQ